MVKLSLSTRRTIGCIWLYNNNNNNINNSLLYCNMVNSDNV